jgi:hypothetical protein
LAITSITTQTPRSYVAPAHKPSCATHHVYPRGAPSGTRRTVFAWNLAGLILLAVNLRPAITGVSPLIARIQSSYYLSALSTSALTTLPVLCMGVFAALAPALRRRYGTEALCLDVLLTGRYPGVSHACHSRKRAVNGRQREASA